MNHKLQDLLLNLQWASYRLAQSMDTSAERMTQLLDLLSELEEPQGFDIDKACDEAMQRVQAQIDASCRLHSHAISSRFAAVKAEMEAEADIWTTAASQVTFRNAYFLRNGWPSAGTPSLSTQLDRVRLERQNPHIGEN